MTETELDPLVRSLACSLCGRRERHADDLYRIRFPDDWTQKNLRAWRDRGATVTELLDAGVRARKVCAQCRIDRGLLAR